MLSKRQPARVELDVGEQGLDCNLGQSNRWKNFDVTGGHGQVRELLDNLSADLSFEDCFARPVWASYS